MTTKSQKHHYPRVGDKKKVKKYFFIKKRIIKFTIKGGIPCGKCIKHTINYSALQRKTPKTEKTLIIILS